MILINVFKEIFKEKHGWFANDFAKVFHGRNLGVVLLDLGMRRHSWCVAHLAWVEVLGVGVLAVFSGIVTTDLGGMILLRSWA